MEQRLADYFANAARQLQKKRLYVLRPAVSGAVKLFAAAKRIQDAFRVHRVYKYIKSNGNHRFFAPHAVKIQSTWRKFLVMRVLAPTKHKRRMAATLLQATFRRFKVKQQMSRDRDAASKIQAAWRELENRRYMERFNDRSQRISVCSMDRTHSIVSTV